MSARLKPLLQNKHHQINTSSNPIMLWPVHMLRPSCFNLKLKCYFEHMSLFCCFIHIGNSFIFKHFLILLIFFQLSVFFLPLVFYSLFSFYSFSSFFIYLYKNWVFWCYVLCIFQWWINRMPRKFLLWSSNSFTLKIFE